MLGIANDAGEDNRNVARMADLFAGASNIVPGDLGGGIPGQLGDCAVALLTVTWG